MTRKPVDLAALLEAQADEYVDVEGAGTFRLRMLDAAGKLRIMSAVRRLAGASGDEIEDQADKLQFGIELLSLSIADEQGRACFNSEAGREAIGRLPLTGLQQLVDVAIRINGLAKEDDEIEGTEKNSVTVTS